MAKSRQKEEQAPATPGWLLTFTGLMILIMAFFVYLVTNASMMDERRVRLAIGSLMGTFGMGTARPDVLGDAESTEMIHPGPLPADQDLAPLKELLWDDLDEDLQFVSNRFVQIFSVNSMVLFAPGETELSVRGRELLSRIAPTLRNVASPVLIAGHASVLRDEFDGSYQAVLMEEMPDPSWRISLFRAMNVYRFMVEQEIPPDKLRMEGLGRFYPREDPQTPRGRRANRRVDFILDPRAQAWAPHLERPETSTLGKDFIYRDFIFHFPEALAVPPPMQPEAAD